MLKRLTIMTLLATLMTGCGLVYKLDIQQGNILEQEDVDKIRPGMTREQIVFILGQPVLESSFHDDTWYYLYEYRPGKGDIRKQRLVLNFDGDRLASLTGTLKPSSAQATSADSDDNEEPLPASDS